MCLALTSLSCGPTLGVSKALLSILQHLTCLQTQPCTQGPGRSRPTPRTCGAPSESAPSSSSCFSFTPDFFCVFLLSVMQFQQPHRTTMTAAPPVLFSLHVANESVARETLCGPQGLSELKSLLCSITSKCLLF